jgi:acetyl esterase/lipase
MVKKWVFRILAGILSAVVVVSIVFAVTPWPSALLIRGIFTENAAKMSAIMAPFAPEGVTAVLDVQYATAASEPLVKSSDFTTLDVYYPDGTTEPLGTVIWTHGGAWISGDKSNDRTYFELLAVQGFTVVGLNYTYGPEAKYPTAVHELNQAHRFLVENADEFNIDPTRIVLAGDSAGSQLSSQIANIITNEEYARALDITPALNPSQLQGMVLNCGVYDMSTMFGSKGILQWGDDMSLWAYTGERNLTTSTAITEMSSIDFVTEAFPPTYITGGNADPLTEGNSKPFAAKLSSLGVDVDALFWPADYTPKLPHEYQFRLDLQAGQDALAATIKFLNERIG